MTKDETWIHHYDPLNQQEARTQKKPDKKTPTRPRVTRSTSKIVMTVLWDCEDVLLVDFLLRGTTINGPYYASLLHQLRSSIQEKDRGKLRCSVLLIHNSAPVHMSNITQAAIQYTDFTELNHHAYSPDLAPRDYHLFSNVKNFFTAGMLRTIMTMNHYSESLASDSFFLEALKVDMINEFV